MVVPRWRYIAWVCATNFVAPLHVVSLDNQKAHHRLSVFNWAEGNQEVCSFDTSQGLKHSTFWEHLELHCTFWGEECLELGKVLKLVRNGERHRGCGVDGSFDLDDVIHLRFAGNDPEREAPSSTRFLFDHQHCIYCGRSEGFERNLKLNWVCTIADGAVDDLNRKRVVKEVFVLVSTFNAMGELFGHWQRSLHKTIKGKRNDLVDSAAGLSKDLLRLTSSSTFGDADNREPPGQGIFDILGCNDDSGVVVKYQRWVECEWYLDGLHRRNYHEGFLHEQFEHAVMCRL
mmetsp:Transcript_18627/g.36433  ORF Transcript_18627/g.36433 Transcript_18627/m.36433 type:complete len:288 (-) Transcript_18627:8002-8865(-)